MDKNFSDVSIFYTFMSTPAELENSLVNKKSVKFYKPIEPENQRFQ